MNIIISPSGEFYGSEQTLYNFLQATNNKYIVYVPRKGSLFEKLRKTEKHKIAVLNLKLPLFYLRIIINIFIKQISTIYWNEGGHINYVRIIARLFPKRKFVVHLRIIEDILYRTLNGLPKNISLITNSEYMKSINKQSCTIQVVYNLYSFKKEIHLKNLHANKITVSIVGRIGKSKGSDYAIDFIKYINEKPDSSNFAFTFFGKPDEEYIEKFNSLKVLCSYCSFINFEQNKSKIYNSNVVVHFSKTEPFGRIFLEALDYNCPFFGSTEGGIGEIARLLSIESFMFDYKNSNWKEFLYNSIIKCNDPKTVKAMKKAKQIAIKKFNKKQYTESIEKHF